VAHGSVNEVRQMAGRSTLEDSFSHLVEESDAEKIASDIVEVMSA
jgi:hypothetical protein